MARPRRGKRRRDHHDWMTDYLLTGIEPPLDHPDLNPFEVIASIYSDSLVLREAWQSSGIMSSWNLPGLRPHGWWLFDAPRLPVGTFPGCCYDGELPEPRRHLGGPGQPLHEVLNYAPDSHFGIWAWYGDPAKPPTFETQFDYLKRHGLLLPGEKEGLPETQVLPPRIMDAATWENLKLRRTL